MGLKLNACGDCSSKVICHCLQVTEDTVIEAITRLELRTVPDVCERTGAGDGCRACRRKIQSYIEIHCSSSRSICSVR